MAAPGAMYECCFRLENFLVQFAPIANSRRETPSLDTLIAENWGFHEENEDLEAVEKLTHRYSG
jgi:hypothetical protein